MTEWTDVIEMNQRAAIVKAIEQGNKSNYKPDPCGGTITGQGVSRNLIRRHGIQGKKAVILECKFCDKESVIADKKCLWCGEDNSWFLNDHKELVCRTCNKKFIGANCRHCQKKSPSLRLFLMYSPEGVAELQSQVAAAAKEEKANAKSAMGCLATIVLIIVATLAIIALNSGPLPTSL